MAKALIIRINCLLVMRWSRSARIKQGGNNEGQPAVIMFSLQAAFTKSFLPGAVLDQQDLDW